MAPTEIVIGIDCGKCILDAAAFPGAGHIRVTNDQAGFRALLAWMAEHGGVRVGLEASGGVAERCICGRWAGKAARISNSAGLSARRMRYVSHLSRQPIGGAMTSGCHSCPIKTQGLCSALSGIELSQMDMVREPPRRIAAGRDLFSQGEPCDEVFNILDGWAFLYELLEDGRRQIVNFALPGDFVGFRTGSRVSTFGAQAIVPVDLCVIPKRRLLAFAHGHPGLALRLMSMLSSDEQLAYERLTSIGRKTALERMAALLLELFYRLQRRAPQVPGELLKIPLTQTLIADATGLTPVHTNRMLQELRQRGVIDYGNGLYRILNPKRLFEIAGVDPAMCAWSLGMAAASEVA